MDIDVERLEKDPEYWDTIRDMLARWQKDKSITVLGIHRPTKGPHDRQRDELIATIRSQGLITSEEIADAILSKYNLDPKP